VNETIPEMEFLLGALHSQPRVSQDLCRQVNWVRLLVLVHRHSVVTLLYSRISNESHVKVPAAGRSLIHAEALKKIGASLAPTRELLWVLSRFEESGIAVIPFKGAVLSAQLYGEPARRDFSDIDLLVKPEDWRRARELLEKSGFKGPGQVGSERAHVFPMQRRVTVELHRSLMDDWFFFNLSADKLLERLVPVRVENQTVWTLSAEDNAVFLCAHGGKHRWSRLGWVCDIAALLTRSPLDWDVVLQRARTEDAVRMVRLGVYLAATLLGCPLAPEVRAEVVGDPATVRLGTQIVAERYRTGTKRKEVFLHGKETSKYYIAIRERYRTRLWYCLFLIWYRCQPTGKDVSVLPLPRMLHMLYYFLRPFRVVREYGWESVRSYVGQFVRILVGSRRPV